MSRIPQPYEIYKHFKGNLYQVLALARHSETGETLVVYQALYGDFQIYARELQDFLEKLDERKYPDASQTFRFELCEKPGALKEEPEFKEKQQEIPSVLGAQPKEEAAQPKEEAAQPKAEVAQPKAEAAQPKEEAVPIPEEEELPIDPVVLRFLDANTHEERLHILIDSRNRLTDEMITTMAIACDIEVPEGGLEERYEQLRYCLATLDKYERAGTDRLR